jgi:hypothetical protein
MLGRWTRAIESPMKSVGAWDEVFAEHGQPSALAGSCLKITLRAATVKVQAIDHNMARPARSFTLAALNRQVKIAAKPEERQSHSHSHFRATMASTRVALRAGT